MRKETELAKIPERVEAGMSRAPGVSISDLKDRIIIDDLIIGCPVNCITGQLYGEFVLWLVHTKVEQKHVVDLGMQTPNFRKPDGSLDENAVRRYDRQLQAEWHKRLTNLQSERNEAPVVQAHVLEPA